MKLFTSILLGFICLFSAAQSNEFYLIVGTYTPPKGNGEGISIYKFNSTNGTASFVSKIFAENPSYLTISSNQQFVYSVNQNGNSKPNEASAFKFDKTSGTLQFLNKESVEGEGPCFITVDKKNKWLFTANYTAGNVSALPINEDGTVGKLAQLIQHKGNSINKSRQSEPHAHTCVFDNKEQFLWATDLGTDKIHRYRFNRKNLTPLLNDTSNYIASKAGNGPRHLAFHNNNLYVVNELSGTIDLFKQQKNKWALVTSTSTDTTMKLDKGSADIHLSNDGKFLYVTDRGKYNSISTFSVQKNGHLIFKGSNSTLGKTPRNFIIDPTNQYVLIANQNSNTIVIFKRDTTTGLLSPTGNEIKVGTPVCLQFVGMN